MAEHAFKPGDRAYRVRINDFDDPPTLVIESTTVDRVQRNGNLVLADRRAAWGHGLVVPTERMSHTKRGAFFRCAFEQNEAAVDLEARVRGLRELEARAIIEANLASEDVETAAPPSEDGA